MKHFLLLAALCVAAPPVLAGVNQWSPVGPDGGSAYGGVLFLAQPNTAIVSTLHGIYRTTDRGANWTRTFQFSAYGYYQGIAANPNPNLAGQVLAHGDGSADILRSTDGGLTWGRVSVAGPTSWVSAAAFTRDGAVAWAGTVDGRMLRSQDGGATWTPHLNGLGLTFQVEQIEVDATDPQVVYAVSNGDIWRTINDGLAWTRVNGTDHYYRMAASRTTHNLIFALRTTQTFSIYRSTNAGDSFTATGRSNIVSVEFMPGVAGRALAVGADNRAYVTENDGVSWTPRGLLPAGGVVMRMSFDTSGTDAVLAATNAGIGYSADGGISWSARGHGIHEMEFGRLVRGASPANYLYAPSYDHEFVYRRDPATGAWSGIASSAASIPQNYQGFSFAEAGGNPRTLYLVKEGTFARSTNDGATWQAMGGITDGRSMTVDPTNPQVIYLGGSAQVAQKSIDGGAHWTPLTGGLPLWGIEDIVVDPSNPQIVYAAVGFYSSSPTPQTTVYRSTDGGATWSPRSAGITDSSLWRLVIHPTRPQTLYAGGSGLWRTTDGGASWSQIYSAGSIFDIAVDPQSPDILYLSSNGNPGSGSSVRSVDGGATWESLQVGGIGSANPNGLWIALVPGQPSTLVHARSSYGLHEMEIAPDVRLSANATILVVSVPQNLTLTLDNAGQFSATNVAFTINLPATAAAATVQSGNASCTQAAQAVNCSIPVLRAGQSVPIGLAFTPTTHAQQMRMMVSAYEPDSQSANNTLDIATERRADLRAQVTSSADTAQTGTTFTYSISITNAGPSAAANLAGTLQLPANVTYASATTSGLTCTQAAAVVTCNAATMAVDATGTATITVNAVTAGAANATLSVTGEGSDPLTPNNTAAKSVTLSDPPPPPPPPTPNPPSSGGGGGGGGGGELDYLLLALLGFALAVSGVKRNSRPGRATDPSR